MENSFTKRFKSSMKITKNNSIFEKLVPIDKKIKPSQIHHELREQKNLDYELFLPKIVTPASIKSNRAGRSHRRTPLHNSYGNKESVFEMVSKSNSPIHFQYKIESDIKRILKTVEKHEDSLCFNFPVKGNRVIRNQQRIL